MRKLILTMSLMTIALQVTLSAQPVQRPAYDVQIKRSRTDQQNKQANAQSNINNDQGLMDHDGY